MPERSIFSDDWQDCQVSHFQHMARAGNTDQRRMARENLRKLGYTEAQISHLYIEATMHGDELPEDFVPDVDLIEQLRETRHPDECNCPSCHPPPRPGAPAP